MCRWGRELEQSSAADPPQYHMGQNLSLREIRVRLAHQINITWPDRHSVCNARRPAEGVRRLFRVALTGVWSSLCHSADSESYLAEF